MRHGEVYWSLCTCYLQESPFPSHKPNGSWQQTWKCFDPVAETCHILSPGLGQDWTKNWERLVSSKILTEFCVNLIGFLWPNPSPSSHRKPGYVKRKSRVLLQIGHDLSFTEIQKQSGLNPLLLVGCWWVQATKVPGWGPIIVIPWIEMEHDGTQTGYPISKPW